MKHKYIDAEKLIAELKRQKRELELSIQSQGDYGQSCQIVDYENIISIIDSLQQEQPVEGLDVTDFCKPVEPGIAKCVADHWWELLDDENAADKKAVKEIVKTVHKEVTRQVKEMVKEQSASEGLAEKDFVEEVRQYYSNNCTWDALKQPMLSIITRCARHFAEWGAEHLKR